MTTNGQWPHQAHAVTELKRRPYYALHWEMGTGKTRAVIDYIREAGAQRVLVVCPKPVIQVWVEQMAKHGQDIGGAGCVLSLNRSSKLNKDAVRIMLSGIDPETLVVVSVNYEAMWREPLGAELLRQRWDLVVLDEAHKCKSPSGKASRFAAKLGQRADKIVLLSGTMLPHSPLDAYGVYRAMDSSIFGTSYTRFRARYAVVSPMFPSSVRSWINQGELKDKLAACTHTVKKGEVLDLPDVIHERMPIDLCKSARRVYNDLDGKFWSDVDSGRVVASNALSRLLRLQQLTGGVAVTEDGRHEWWDHGKCEAIREILDDLPTDEPVVIFSRFHDDLDAISEITNSMNRKCLELSGRVNAYSLWRNMTGGEVLNAQIQAGGVGVDLSRARYCIYYSVGFSLADYLQSLARTHRAGQTRKVIYYHLVVRDSVDEKVYKALAQRKRIIDSVMGIE